MFYFFVYFTEQAPVSSMPLLLHILSDLCKRQQHVCVTFFFLLIKSLGKIFQKFQSKSHCVAETDK